MRWAVRMMRRAISPRFAIRSRRTVASHPKHAKPRFRDGGVQGSVQPQCQHAARLDRINYTIIPEPSRRVVRMALALVLGTDLRFEILLVVALAAHFSQHVGGLLPAHHGNAGIGPHPKEPWTVGAAAHAII